MPILRTDIERALDEIISNEEGMRLQGIAVILAKQKWPSLVACERKKDLGLDAHADALLAQDGVGVGLACSLTNKYEKIKSDAVGAKERFKGLRILIFTTPHKITNQTGERWKEQLRKDCDLELVLVTREDLIASLLLPANAVICGSQLGLPITLTAGSEDKLKAAIQASSEIASAWSKHWRLDGKPLVELSAMRLNDDGAQTDERFSIADMQERLKQGGRLVLEAPAGRGKTTTLVQLAMKQLGSNELPLLVDLPDWARMNLPILEFVAQAPQFAGKGITSGDLAALANDVPFVFLLNGWNEIAPADGTAAARALIALERDFPTAGIVVATRPHMLSPLPGSTKLRLLRLSTVQRADYLRRRLTTRADELRHLIETRRALNDLTLTPMILSEVTTLFELGRPIPDTKLGIMDSVLLAIESADHHKPSLVAAPLDGLGREYLIDLAAKMTSARGGVRLDDANARRSCVETAERLKAAKITTRSPDPVEVLGLLCAHHVLERMDYPAAQYRFEHQQFQEFLASCHIVRELERLAASTSATEVQAFAQARLDQPVWGEPLYMAAEDLGSRISRGENPTALISAGALLVNAALDVDPILASELSWICGPVVWKQVSAKVNSVLRTWYACNDECHKDLALEAMIATGSPEFGDVIVPLIRSSNQQRRLRTYHLTRAFHFETLGSDWLKVVQEWPDNERGDFFIELLHSGDLLDSLDTVLASEPSPDVRARIIETCEWERDPAIFESVLSKADADVFDRVVRKIRTDAIPPSLQPRAIENHRRQLQACKTGVDKLRVLLRMMELKANDALPETKAALTGLVADRLGTDSQGLLEACLRRVAEGDPVWVSQWVKERILAHSLGHREWLKYVRPLEPAERAQIFARFCSNSLNRNAESGHSDLLSLRADASFASAVFNTMCEVRRGIVNPQAAESRPVWEVVSRLERLFRHLPKSISVQGLLESVKGDFDPLQFRLAADLVGQIGHEENEYPTLVEAAALNLLRSYFKNGVDHTLGIDDPAGDQKRDLALSLARVGKSEDFADIKRLLRADIERVAVARAAQLDRARSGSVNQALMVQNSWFIRACEILDARGTEEFLLELLHEPHYEYESGLALIRRARSADPSDLLRSGYFDLKAIRMARAGAPLPFKEDARRRYVLAIKERLGEVEAERAQSDKPDHFNGRLKTFARLLSILDGQASADMVLEIAALEGKWGGWGRVTTLSCLLESGSQLDVNKVLAVLEPEFSHLEEQGFWGEQNQSLLVGCLCILPFTNPAERGIQRMNEMIVKAKMRAFDLRQVIQALGASRTDAAGQALVEIERADQDGIKNVMHEWLDAIIENDTVTARAVLLDLVNPATPDTRLGAYVLSQFDDRASRALAALARSNSDIKKSLFGYSTDQLSVQKREILARAFAAFETDDAVITSLNLIDDKATSVVPRGVWTGLEAHFIEHRSIDGSGYNFSKVARSGNSVRKKLFDLALTDPNRKASAFGLLGEIERMRRTDGKPVDEPRHPDIGRGAPWPILTRTG